MSDYSALLVDLDGTLVHFDTERFVHEYLSRVVRHFHVLPDASRVPNWILQGTQLMLSNKGTKTNKEIFVDYFSAKSGLRPEQIWKIFLHFYEHDFRSIGEMTVPNTDMVNLMQNAHAKGFRIVIATQPVFPELAVKIRLGWAGASQLQFEFITHIENSKACKPSEIYFNDVLQKLNVQASRCLMIGNDPQADLGAQQAGIDTFLLGTTNHPTAKYAGNERDLSKLLGLD